MIIYVDLQCTQTDYTEMPMSTHADWLAVDRWLCNHTQTCRQHKDIYLNTHRLTDYIQIAMQTEADTLHIDVQENIHIGWLTDCKVMIRQTHPGWQTVPRFIYHSLMLHTDAFANTWQLTDCTWRKCKHTQIGRLLTDAHENAHWLIIHRWTCKHTQTDKLHTDVCI